jgi:hypothetical protein
MALIRIRTDLRLVLQNPVWDGAYVCTLEAHHSMSVETELLPTNSLRKVGSLTASTADTGQIHFLERTKIRNNHGR